MDDEISVIKRQVEKGHVIDGEAREIYRVAILVVSIIVAAAAINLDVLNLIQTMIYDLGFVFSTDESSLLIKSFDYFGGWAIFPAVIILSLIAFAFSLTFVMVVGFFFASPYYAVRAQSSAPISSDEHAFELIAYDIAVFINTDPFKRLIPKRYQEKLPTGEEKRIISDIEQEFEDYDRLEEVINHNKAVLLNKSTNLSRAKNSTLRFFISMLIFAIITTTMIYL